VPISEDILKKLSSLNTRPEGLSSGEAASRSPFSRKQDSLALEGLKILYHNFSSPLVILLLIAAFFSVYFKDVINAYIIFSIVIASGLISCIQELKALVDTRRLIQSMKMTHTVLRNNAQIKIDPESLVVGDILCVDAGDLIPLNCELIESTDIFANESSLTGESLPKEKSIQGDHLLKMGSYIVSGMGKAVIIPQDKNNSYSELLSYISRTQEVSSFTRNLVQFSQFLMKVTLVFTSIVLVVLLFCKSSPLQAFLFALSIAIGLSPQLLPAILTTNLAIGARKMAEAGAVTKRLECIESFGNMDILCCDKTGTLTKGKIEMYAALDTFGIKSDEVRRLSFINAFLQTGFHNTLDQAIIEANHFDHSSFKKLDEIPYDFNRKILSIYAEVEGKNLLISKGALENILVRCDLHEEEKEKILERAKTYYAQGFRLLGLAAKELKSSLVNANDETHMSFKGFLLFFDPLKEDCHEVLTHLKDLGIRLIMITGDHPVVASYVAKNAGFLKTEAFEGNHLDFTSDKTIDSILNNYDVFARVEPLDKASIIKAYKSRGHTVGFLGDGINDSGALYIADIGISVESGSDIAKATCDLILGKKQLSILVQAVKEGRKIFGNTIKYILMAVSANFGNMFSMAAVALFIPFLPLLPTQILLINLLQDIPEMSISVDHVDQDVIRKPQKWNISFIKKFMLVFGPISSLFDFTTFSVLKYFQATPEEFRSAWFTESVLSATFVILFIRTKHPFFKSKPSWLLTSLVFVVIGITLILPYTQIGSMFSLTPLKKEFYIAIYAIVITYVITVEIAKKIFYKLLVKRPQKSLN
jgi:P-type Mg2+ transporter